MTRFGMVCLASMLMLVGCKEVTSPVPFGEQPYAADAEQWTGRWSAGDASLVISVIDAAQGRLHVRLEEPGSAPEDYDVQLRSSGDWIFASVLDTDHPGNHEQADSDAGAESEPRYLWGRVSIGGNDQLVGWDPAPAAFAKLVEAGLLPGTVDDGSVHLGELDPDQYHIITSSSQGVLLDWEHPTVFYRTAPTSNHPD